MKTKQIPKEKKCKTKRRRKSGANQITGKLAVIVGREWLDGDGVVKLEFLEEGEEEGDKQRSGADGKEEQLRYSGHSRRCNIKVRWQSALTETQMFLHDIKI